MLKNNLTKILSTAIIFAVLIGIVITISGAAKILPQKEFGEAPKLLPDVIFGSKGENILPNMEQTTGENEENPPDKDLPQQIPESLKSLFKVQTVLRQKGDTVIAVPSRIAADVSVLESALHVLSAGCAVGVLKGQTLDIGNSAVKQNDRHQQRGDEPQYGDVDIGKINGKTAEYLNNTVHSPTSFIGDSGGKARWRFPP